MGLIRLCGRKAAIWRHPSGLTIRIRVAVLFLCLTGLAGCSSSPSSVAGAAPSSVLGGSASPSPSGCFTTGYLHRDHKSLTAGQPVLASAQLVDPIPDPDIDIDLDPQAYQDQETWAQAEKEQASSLEVPPQVGLQPTEANLQSVANGVVAREDKTLSAEDVIDYLAGDDFADQMCKLATALDNGITAGTLNPNNPIQFADALMSLTSSADPYAPDALAGVVKDTYNLFQNAFPQCNSVLSTVQWIIEQVEALFCGTG